MLATYSIQSAPPSPSARSGKLGALVEQLTQLRIQIADLESRASESWQAMHAQRAVGTPSGVTDAAVQQVVNQHYRQEIAKLTLLQRKLEQDRESFHEEAKDLRNARAETHKYVERAQERYDLYKAVGAKLTEAAAIGQGDYRVLEGIRLAMGELAPCLSGMERALHSLANIEKNLLEIGSE